MKLNETSFTLRAVCAVLLSAVLITLVGCRERTYEIAWDGFCYTGDGMEAIELKRGCAAKIVDVMNGAEWNYSVANCSFDYTFITQRQRVGYHSECGTLCDYTRQASARLSESERLFVNECLGIYP